MQIAIWIIIGVVAAAIARGIMRERSFGLLGDLMLGLLGAIVGGWVFHWLGFNSPHDLLRHAFVSLVGAVVVLGLARWLRPVVRETEKLLGGTGEVSDLETHIRRLGEWERRVLERTLKGPTPLRDPNAVYDATLTFGQRLADKVAAYGGSWLFICTFLVIMGAWIAVNTNEQIRWDPYPFILLNLMLSCLAALQAPIIMMSQNRQAVKDRLDARTDYEVNLRAELEIQRLHAKLDAQRAGEWKELFELQQRQIELLDRITARMTQ